MRKSHSNEGHVKEDVKELLKAHDAWYVMPIGGSFSSVGIPDFVCCIYGQLWGIETKFGGNKPTPMQNKHLRDIQLAGGRSMVVTEKNLNELSLQLDVARVRAGVEHASHT
jgi:hypothetical protein